MVEDLNARVDLNRSSDLVIEGLLRQFVPGATAEELTSSLRAVTGGGDAGVEPALQLQIEDSTTRSGQLPGRPLMHVEELARVPGFGASLAAELAPFVTVWGDGLVNVNTAPFTVLAALPDVGTAAARALVDAREGGRIYPSRLAVYSELSERSTEVSSRLPDVTTTSRRVLIVSRGWEEGQAYSHEVQAVFDVLASRLVTGARVRLRYWVEKER
jgi:type II secretory pathway component PulK